MFKILKYIIAYITFFAGYNTLASSTKTHDSTFRISSKIESSWQMEFAISKARFNRNSMALRFIKGYSLYNQRFYFGIGTGIMETRPKQGYIYYYPYLSYPIFLRFSYIPFRKHTQTYIFSDLQTLIEHKKWGGQNKPIGYRVGFGEKIKLKKNDILCSLSYGYGISRYTYNYNKIGLSDWYINHRIEFLVGFQFH